MAQHDRSTAGTSGAILRTALDEVKRQVAAMPRPSNGTRVTGFVVRDHEGIKLGVGAIIGDDVAISSSLRDSVKDGRIKIDEFRFEFVWSPGRSEGKV